MRQATRTFDATEIICVRNIKPAKVHFELRGLFISIRINQRRRHYCYLLPARNASRSDAGGLVNCNLLVHIPCLL